MRRGDRGEVSQARKMYSRTDATGLTSRTLCPARSPAVPDVLSMIYLGNHDIMTADQRSAQRPIRFVLRRRSRIPY